MCERVKRIAVLASGNGSNFQALLDAISNNELKVEVSVLVTNVVDAYVVERAKNFNVSYVYVKRFKNENRADYDFRLAGIIKSFNPDFVFLLGWLRILTKNFLQHFTVVNLHPALPNTFAGLHCIEKQFDAFQKREITQCGIMTHYVPTEEVDAGPVIFSETVPCVLGEDMAAFEERVHSFEHKLVVKTIKFLCED